MDDRFHENDLIGPQSARCNMTCDKVLSNIIIISMHNYYAPRKTIILGTSKSSRKTIILGTPKDILALGTPQDYYFSHIERYFSFRHTERYR